MSKQATAQRIRLGMRHAARVMLLGASLLLATGSVQGQEQEAPPREAALAALRSGDYEAAATHARDYIAAHPQSPALFNTLGEALLATGKLEAAKRAFQNAVDGGAPDRLAAELNLALISYRRGELGEAYAQFERVLDYYRGGRVRGSDDLTAVATATAYLGITRPAMYKAAVDLYLEAIVYDRENDDARIALGNLLLDKYNNEEARDVFEEVLESRPHDASALLGLARSQHFDHSAEAMTTVQRALQANPRLVPALVFLARLLIESEQYDAAKAQAEEALATDPSSLEALSVLAAVYYLTRKDDAFDATVRRLLALNPRYAELYNTLAELAADNRLYADAAELASKAIALDKHSWRAFGLLGLNQLRIGRIEEGINNLENAFDGDPYNVWIKNTLDLTDTFSDYHERVEGRFQLMLHADESALLTPYLLPLAEATFDEFVARYGYRPETPLRIELYPRHADFSVRTVGLAGVGILGVCFGPVVAMDSPSARAQGSFNWGSTLRHELAHTFHLGITDHRAPRWFSEGLAVHEERRGIEGWGGDVSPSFLAALRDGKLLPVSRLNDGFVRPSYPEQIIHAYYQSSLVLELIEAEWGFAAVRSMLDAYRQGKSHDEAVQGALGLTSAELDARFKAHLAKRFSGPLQALEHRTQDAPHSDTPADIETVVAQAEHAPKDFAAQLRAGQALLESGGHSRAESFLHKAQALFPEYAGDDSPYWLLARLYQERNEPAAAAEQLERMVAINAEHYDAHIMLAKIKQELGDTRAAADILDRAIYIYPLSIDVHAQLAELYGTLDEWTLAARERAAVVALAPVDMAAARLALAEAHFRAGDMASARSEVIQALELAPNYEAAQDLLLKIRENDSSSNEHAPNRHRAPVGAVIPLQGTAVAKQSRCHTATVGGAA